MEPVTARVLMTLIVLAFVIGATVLVNSRFHGNFAVGIVLILVPLSRPVVFVAVFFACPL
jgi:hypothetical protein